MNIRSLFAVLLLVGLAAGSGSAQDDHDVGQSLSPFFYVQSDDPSTDRLPLKSTAADVRIAGIIADVTVTQTYRNEGTRALEAVYIFPGSTRAAVYAMTMTIGERTVVAQIQEERGPPGIRDRQAQRSDRVVAGAASPQRLSDECGQHPAR